jgi:hypothetical protein
LCKGMVDVWLELAVVPSCMHFHEFLLLTPIGGRSVVKLKTGVHHSA